VDRPYLGWDVDRLCGGIYARCPSYFNSSLITLRIAPNLVKWSAMASLAIVGHLGQIIAIAVVVLIGSGILIWANWKRR
jgi:hypothetical protein